MINLAGDREANRHIRRELERCGIEIVEHGKLVRGEVPTTVTGRLGPFEFDRRWRYWNVDGYVPLEVAKALYEDIVGREDIRATGHCGCLDPETQITWINEKGEKLCRKSELDSYSQDSDFYKTLISLDGISWVDDPTQGIPVIDGYHIDSELGLYIFVQHIKKYLEGSDNAG